MGMCVQKFRNLIFLAVAAYLCGCGPMDTLLPSAGTYKVSARINGIPVNELSFIGSGDKIRPYLEDPVSGDPDVTALIVFLRNSKGNIMGWKVIYTLDTEYIEEDDDPLYVSPNISSDVPSEETQENLDEEEALSEDDDLVSAEVVVEDKQAPEYYRNGDEIVIPVMSLDAELPLFPMPKDLPMGRYTLVYQVMSGKDTLQRIEKNIYYLGNTVFSYNGIQVHLPGITETPQLIPKGTVIMLEAILDYGTGLNPYIVWYNGRRKIGEGNVSDGTGYLLWKAPEQSGFFSLRAEIFPTEDYDGLSGYQKEISLLVSSKATDMHLVSENNSQLVHWYVFEGNLNDSKAISSMDRALKPAAKNSPRWMPSNGTYGLVTGTRNVFTLPKISVLNDGTETWQMLFRFKPLSNGEVLSVQFGDSNNVFMILKTEDDNLALELVSPLGTVSQAYALPEQDSFITAEINFSTFEGMLSADLYIVGDYISEAETETDTKPVIIEAEIKDGFQILLGAGLENILADEPKTTDKQVFTALWDEFAFYLRPKEIIATETESSVEVIAENAESLVDEEQPEGDAVSIN